MGNKGTQSDTRRGARTRPPGVVSATISAVVVAPNMAVHRPLSVRLSRTYWDVTQISSGNRVGRFTERPAAANYAGLLVERVPALLTTSQLSDDEIRLCREVRAECGGVQ